MAAITLLGSATFDTNSGTHTVTATPAVGDLIIIVVANTGSTASVAPTDNNADGLGTYTKVASALKATNVDMMEFWVRDAFIGNASSTIFTQAPGTTTGGGLAVHKITSMTLSGVSAIRQIAKQDNQAAAGTPTPVFDTAPLTGNAIIGAVFNATSPATMTPRTNFTETADVGYSTPTTGLETMIRNSGETATSQAWGGLSGSAFCSIIVELDTSSAISLPKLVQSNTGGTISGENDTTLSFSKLPNVGNYILITLASGGPSGPEKTPTDNQGTTYTAIGSPQTTVGGERIQAYIGRVVGAAGTFTINMQRNNPGGGGWGCDFSIFEYKNIDAVTPVDQNNGTVNNTGSTTPTSPSITPSRANTLVLGIEADDASSDTNAMNAGTNYVLRSRQLVISTRQRYGVEEKSSFGTSAVTATFTVGASATWAIKIFNLNPPIVGTAVPNKIFNIKQAVNRAATY